ncbi:protein phosphatase 1 regulatory subunit 17 [Scleropages formosus]|uniref:protein phosphatase 1 regulatory subunit 17 n=1 Tax=Scleropages formosus TaxID=113540 RepID=UPI000878A138|nr:protein phosphatase 1 regulatory subunit 17 [Scleropages formosus]
MSADCVRSSAETGQCGGNGRQEHPCPVSSVSGTLIGNQSLGALESDKRNEHEFKKPRRKDTPVLNAPPLVPGVKMMKEKRRVIHVEDEEKDGNN